MPGMPLSHRLEAFGRVAAHMVGDGFNLFKVGEPSGENPA